MSGIDQLCSNTFTIHTRSRILYKYIHMHIHVCIYKIALEVEAEEVLAVGAHAHKKALHSRARPQRLSERGLC